MAIRGILRSTVLFLGGYLLLSMPVFLVRNRDVLDAVVNRLLTSVSAIALSALTAGLIVFVLVVATDGVEKYNAFLLHPTDVLSILVTCSYVWAAVSWWAVPELLLWTDTFIGLRPVLGLIVLSHVPMFVFLSMLTVATRLG